MISWYPVLGLSFSDTITPVSDPVEETPQDTPKPVEQSA